jgi:hypothetical protein
LGKAYGLNTQVLLANLQHFCNNIIILNYYYFIPGLFLSHSWWAESCSVRLSRGMVCSRQPRSFQGVYPHGRPDEWTEDKQRTDDGTHGFKGGFILPLIYRMTSVCPVPKAQVCVCQGGEANFLLIFPPSFLSLFLYVFPLHLPWYVLCSLMFPNNSQ